MNPYALHMPHWPKPMVEAPGTASERARILLARLGHPQLHLPPVVHVGGTKGKGSTIAFLRAMLEAAGYRVHVYTSPHLARFNERIVLAGEEISDPMLHNTLEEVRLAAGDFPVGFFDATTAAAVVAFQRVSADILLIEMGLGGLVDATNIIDTPLLSILTTLSYDHMELMGRTLEEIARFESGLFKPHVPCIVGYQPEEVWETLREQAALTHTPLYEYGRHFQTRRREGLMIFADTHGEVTLPLPSLLGAHQVVNAGTAIAAISALTDFDVEPEHVIRGLLEAQWKGRLSLLRTEGESEIWFDGGHNEAAARAIALFAREHWGDLPLYLIFGTTQGKDIGAMMVPFAGIVSQVYSVSVKSEPKSYSAEQAAAQMQPHLPCQPADSIQDALEDIRDKETDFRALIFGSLYLWLEATQL